MAFVLNDRVKQTSTTTGTGTFSLTGTETGFETFVTGIGDTNSTFYAIANDGTSEFEVGIGTVTDAALIHFLEIPLSPLLTQITKLILVLEQKLFSVHTLQREHRQRA